MERIQARIDPTNRVRTILRRKDSNTEIVLALEILVSIQKAERILMKPRSYQCTVKTSTVNRCRYMSLNVLISVKGTQGLGPESKSIKGLNDVSTNISLKTTNGRGRNGRPLRNDNVGTTEQLTGERMRDKTSKLTCPHQARGREMVDMIHHQKVTRVAQGIGNREEYLAARSQQLSKTLQCSNGIDNMLKHKMGRDKVKASMPVCRKTMGCLFGSGDPALPEADVIIADIKDGWT